MKDMDASLTIVKRVRLPRYYGNGTFDTYIDMYPIDIPRRWEELLSISDRNYLANLRIGYKNDPLY